MTTITKQELEERLREQSPKWWNGSKERVGKENYYHCQTCRSGVVTVDRDAGTTPMFLSCYATDGCTGVMFSMGYPDPRSKPAHLGEATHEWYRPDEIDDDSDTAEMDHVLAGGLLLREVEPSGADQT